MTAPVYGLVLAGGRSTRMQRDKAVLEYAGRPQLLAAYELVASLTGRAFISVRADQRAEPLRASLPQIVDAVDAEGPIAGILTALDAHPDHAWLVVACDLPRLDRATLERLLAERDASQLATAYRSAYDGLPEPLCAIYEPASREPLHAWLASGRNCPRKFLGKPGVRLLDLADDRALDNVNTPEEYTATQAAARHDHA
jgi:molybdopterin-guanine dinucleotide biosynthesis protein A